MIHGGEHGLRFTPSFDITSAEVDMIVELVGRGLQEIPPMRSRSADDAGAPGAEAL